MHSSVVQEKLPSQLVSIGNDHLQKLHLVSGGRTKAFEGEAI